MSTKAPKISPDGLLFYELGIRFRQMTELMGYSASLLHYFQQTSTIEDGYRTLRERLVALETIFDRCMTQLQFSKSLCRGGTKLIGSIGRSLGSYVAASKQEEKYFSYTAMEHAIDELHLRLLTIAMSSSRMQTGSWFQLGLEIAAVSDVEVDGRPIWKNKSRLEQYLGQLDISMESLVVESQAELTDPRFDFLIVETDANQPRFSCLRGWLQIEAGLEKLKCGAGVDGKTNRLIQKSTTFRMTRNDSRVMLIQALLMHHGFESEEFNPEPASSEKLEKLTGFSQSKVSRAMRELFGKGGFYAYKTACRNEAIRGFLQKLDEESVVVAAPQYKPFQPTEDEERQAIND